jgi:SPP1 family predicted phage head-tail adaptor
MTSGRLRERIVVQDQGTIVDDIGDTKTAWFDVAQAWARMEPVRGATIMIGDKPQATLNWRCLIRADSRIKSTMRVVWKGRFFTIDSIANMDERGAYLTLLLTENTAP